MTLAETLVGIDTKSAIQTRNLSKKSSPLISHADMPVGGLFPHDAAKNR